jgi:hypothetical protein
MSPQYNYLLFYYYCIVYLLFINCYCYCYCYLLYVILFVCYLLLLLICCIYCYLCCLVYLLLWCDGSEGNRTRAGQGEDVHTSIFRPVGPPVDSSEWRLLWGVDELQGGLRERCVLLHLLLWLRTNSITYCLRTRGGEGWCWS